MAMKFHSRIRQEVRDILGDRDVLIAHLRRYPSLIALSEGIGTSVTMLTKARKYHNIPARAAYKYAIVDLAGKTVHDVKEDKDAQRTLMIRAYSRLGWCPPHCVHDTGRSCPKTPDPDKDYDQDDDEAGLMHEQCPVWYYEGSDRGTETPIQVSARMARASLILKKFEAENGADALAEAVGLGQETLPPKPEGLSDFLAWVTTEEADAHYGPKGRQR